MDVVYKVKKLFQTMDYVIRRGNAYEKGSPEWLAADDEIAEIFRQLEELKPFVTPDDAFNILVELNKLVDQWEIKD